MDSKQWFGLGFVGLVSLTFLVSLIVHISLLVVKIIAGKNAKV